MYNRYLLVFKDIHKRRYVDIMLLSDFCVHQFKYIIITHNSFRVRLSEWLISTVVLSIKLFFRV